MKLSLILITAVPEIAASCVRAGVDRTMVDFEVIGKKERQGHRDEQGHQRRDEECRRRGDAAAAREDVGEPGGDIGGHGTASVSRD